MVLDINLLFWLKPNPKIMDTYTVKSGDSLSAIAIKIYGDANKWRELADLNNIADPSKIRIGQVLNLIPKQGIVTGTDKALGTDTAEISVDSKTVYYRFKGTTEKIFLGSRYKLGISRLGSFNTEKFIAGNASLLTALKLSKSEINTLLATSQNEGNLDSINTWDNSFLSCGMFQWTLGQRTDPGELPALLKVIKEKQPEAFKTYFGDFGIGLSSSTDSRTGFLTLNNTIQNTVSRKSAFRNNIWALRFALAGKDPAICSAQVLHAINRFDTFYFTPYSDFDGFTINEMLSSEYAASLLIDQHVNRPGHVKKVITAALQQSGMTPGQLASGTNADEMKLISKYLVIRETYGGGGKMTDSSKRAKVVKKFLDQGLIKATKKSFVSNRKLR